MDMFWNKRLSILKFHIIFVAMLPKFFYNHTWNNQVLQHFIMFIIFKTTKKCCHCDLRISVGFIHNGILLLRSLWRILRRRRSSMSGILLLRSLWRILRRRGSMRRRHWRRNMWWRMRLKSMCSWCILKRRGSVRWRLWRMNMW
jgi:hypothetical protein